MNRLLIIGAGGFGREVLQWARDVPADRRDWELGGFLDARPGALDGFGVNLPIVGDPTGYRPGPGDCFLCALGDPDTKLRLTRGLKERGASFVTLVHPSARIPPGNRVGEGCIFCPNSGLTTNVTVGDFVTFNTYSGAGHDAVMGDGCTFSSHVDVHGSVKLGEGVFLGSHASVLSGIKVGDYAKIGAGAVVVRNVKARTSVFGNPARQIAGFDTE
jgi:sugar O-acyltransferase (sialic acid O-acetyltransferase NeuD family)